MRKVIFTTLLAMLIPSAAQASPPHLQWDHESRAVMTESITALGGGQYHYGYTLANNDVTGIWMFIVYTPYQVQLNHMFDKPNWGGDTNMPEFSGPYDPRNLVPSIRCLAFTKSNVYQYTPPGPYAWNPIAVGETVVGFGFIANVYDPSPKLYVYELEGDYAVHSGKVSAFGYTVIPEASSLLALLAGLGGLGGMLLRRRGWRAR